MPRRGHNEHTFDSDARPLTEQQVMAVLAAKGQLAFVRSGFYAVVGDETVCVPSAVVKSLMIKHELQRSTRTADGERYIADTPAEFKKRNKAEGDKRRRKKQKQVKELADGLLAALGKGRKDFEAEVERIADDNFFL